MLLRVDHIVFLSLELFLGYVFCRTLRFSASSPFPAFRRTRYLQLSCLSDLNFGTFKSNGMIRQRSVFV